MKAEIQIRWRKAWIKYYLLAFVIAGVGTALVASDYNIGYGFIVASLGFLWVAMFISLNGPEKFELVDSDE